jgi:hypothetical protein
MKRDNAVLLLLLGGFVLLGIDVRYEHRLVVGEHWQAWLPIAACGLCAMACLASMGAARWARGLSGWVFGLSILTGLYGSFLHTEGDAGEYAKYLAFGEGGGRKDGGEGSPALAPLGLTGLAAIGLVVSQRWFKAGK